MRNGEVFRTEGNIILGNGGDDLIFRMLENRPDIKALSKGYLSIPLK